MAVTGLTRNQFTGFKPVRGFESLRLRWKALEKSRAFVIRVAYFSGIFSLAMTNAFKCLVREMRYVKYYFGTSFSYLKREFGNC